MPRTAFYAAIAAAALLLAACGSSGNSASKATSNSQPTSTSSSNTGGHSGSASSGSSGSSSSATNLNDALSFDASSKTATLHLTGGDPNVNYGFDYNGTSKGQMAVTIPEGWTVTVHFTVVKNSKYNHSAVVVASSSAKSPAFPGAATPNPTVGARPGVTQSFTFTASKVGTYRIACLVPGHEAGGMWVTLKIVGTGEPSIQ